MDEAQIKHMVDRFLCWRLPDDFNPDGGISFRSMYNENTPWPMKHEPVGTNLLNASQAEAMIRHLVEGMEPSMSEATMGKELKIVIDDGMPMGDDPKQPPPKEPPKKEKGWKALWRRLIGS